MRLYGEAHKAKFVWIIASALLVVSTGLVVIFSWSHWPAHLIGGLATSIAQAVNSADYQAMVFLNQFAHRSWTFDRFFYLADANWLATAPLLVALSWFWFKEGKETARNREFLLSTLIAPFPAVIVARILAYSLPFRERPLRNPALHFQLPYSMRPERLLGWSAFPSDTAALWFALAVGLLFVSRRTGALLLAYVCLVLALARVYLGIHYPSDILVGGLIGAGVVSLARYPVIRTAVTRWPLQVLQRAPHVFYTCFFLISAGMSERFSSLHQITEFAGLAIKAIGKLL